jgi:hypothetical protein
VATTLFSSERHQHKSEEAIGMVFIVGVHHR